LPVNETLMKSCRCNVPSLSNQRGRFGLDPSQESLAADSLDRLLLLQVGAAEGVHLTDVLLQKVSLMEQVLRQGHAAAGINVPEPPKLTELAPQPEVLDSLSSLLSHLIKRGIW